MVKGETSIDWDSYKNPGKKLLEFKEDKRYIDLVLESSEGQQFQVHSVIMSSLSKKFWSYLTSLMEETPNETTLKDFAGEKQICQFVRVHLPSHVLQAFINYAYKGILSTDALHVWEILEEAEKFKIRDAENECCTLITKLVTRDNCTEMYRMAAGREHKKLLAASLEVIQRNLLHVIDQGIFFATLDLESLQKILCSDYLNAPEEKVWTAIKKWVSFDHQNRRFNLPILFKSIRLLRTPPGFITGVLSDPIIDDSKIRFEIISSYEDAFTLQEVRGEDFMKDGNGLLVDMYLEYARPRTPNEVIIGIGGYKDSRCSKHIECYDSVTNLWFEYPRQFRCPIKAYHGAQWFEKKVWIIGGGNGSQYLATVNSWDPSVGSWKSEASLQSKRCFVMTAVCQEKLYAIGGHNSDNLMRSVEVYNPIQKTWEAGREMIANRSDGAACVIDNKIFVIGGLNENGIERSAEVFDVDKNEWTLLPEMAHRRTSLGAVALLGFVYAIGGNDGLMKQSSAERFDPTTNHWSRIANMNQGRSTFSAAVMNHKIYVTGGHNASTTISSVEVFDPSTGIWTEVTSMRYPRSGLALLTLCNVAFLSQLSYSGLFNYNERISRSRSRSRRRMRGIPADEE